ncbi:unnamed protein product [Toxocara canis]|uniref:Intraflagellar transport protein 81 homolog n=1 Tax=Toxocara canis TaxID=6265 RepID=A0A183V3M4_TOXCA|nr:unnamed protein product [Toxocara canis]
MTAEALKTIVDGLNAEPFNMNLNLISFDSMSSGRLIQVLSDVIGWIENDETIDIREEAPDQTALRIFNSLRILKYRPPNDIEQLQEWRRGIVEGEKTAIYPILEWIFSDPEPLKERAYLAKYLVKVDVPGNFIAHSVSQHNVSIYLRISRYRIQTKRYGITEEAQKGAYEEGEGWIN